MKKIIQILLIILIIYIYQINFSAIKTRIIEKNEKLYEISVYEGKTLVRSVVLNKIPEIKNNTITLLSSRKEPIKYTNVRIIVNELKEKK